MCNGQLLPINQNQALFSLLGTQFGGDGRVNFALPNLQGCVPLHMGQGPGLSSFTIGQRGGEENHALTSAELGSHTHVATASVNAASQAGPGSAYWATTSAGTFGTQATAAMAAAAIESAGGGQPHANMQPFLTLNFVIALQGIFPSSN